MSSTRQTEPLKRADSACEPPRLLRIGDVARAVQISERTVYDLIARGALRAVHIGRCVRIPRSELDRLCGDADEPEERFGLAPEATAAVG